MQLKLKETKETLMKGREAAKKAAEQIPVIQEVPVIDHSLMDKITAENDKLKALVDSLEKRIDETEKKYEEMNKLNEERLKQALEAESKIIQLKTNMQRLEEKMYEMESESQILRHQSLLSTSVTRWLALPPTSATKNPENGHIANGENSANEPQSVTPVKKYGTETDTKFRRSIIDHQHDQEDNEHMAYWLSNTSSLLFLLLSSLKGACSSGSSSHRKPPAPMSLLGRMTMGFRSSPPSASLAAPPLEVVRQVDAKYPALLSKQQLPAYVEKIYGIVRDNLKKELASLLTLCIQVLQRGRGLARSMVDGKRAHNQ